MIHLLKMEVDMNINAKNIVHHGAECVAFVAIGTIGGLSFSAACAAYATGKITYLGTRMLLNAAAPTLSKQTQRSISWAASLLVGGSTLRIVQAEVAKQSVSALNT